MSDAMAMLRFLNGDRREICLNSTQVRSDGHPADTLRWQDGDDGVGGEKVGIRTFWLDIMSYRAGRLIRYDEVPR